MLCESCATFTNCPTPRAPEPSTRGATPYRAEPQSGTAGGTLRVFRQFAWLGFGFVKMALSRSAPPLMPTVETVEKVPFRKLIFGKWDKNTEKRLVFCVPNNILAFFEPVVGDFCEDFSSKEFFDSLVGWLSLMKSSKIESGGLRGS